METMGVVAVVVPGRLETRTGGYIYDRRMVDELGALGWSVAVHELDDSFPHPAPHALDHAARVLAAMPDQATVLIDGLAYGAMPDVVAHEAERLRLVALVHHPLAAEGGQSPEILARLKDDETRALAAARLVVVTSRATAVALQEYGVGKDRVRVVEPGTDRAPVAAGSKEGVVALLCVATLTPRKGHATLFRALGRLRHLPWRLTCVGSLDRDRETVAELRAFLSANALEDRVSLVGEADPAAVAEYYNRADVFVLPTEYEGYGMAVAEALARGLPVISTRTGAIPEIAIDGAGLLVQPGDVDAVTEALSTVLTERAVRDRLSRNAVLVRDRLPSWKVACLKMADALERVAAADERVQR